MSKDPIVVDRGSLWTRIGGASMEEPDDIIPTCLPSNPVVPLVAHGDIRDFDGYAELLSAEFEKLKIDSASRDFLVSDRVNRAMDQREKEIELYFETLKVPSLGMVPSPTLAMYSLDNLTTGVFVDIGEGGTDIQCFYHGLYVRPGSKFTAMGGLTMTKYLQHVIVKRNRQWIDNLNWLRQFREEQAYVPMNGIDEKRICVNLGASSLNFTTELAKTGNFLFAPHAFSCGIQGLPEIIIDSIRSCEPGMMNELCQHIRLCGGVANMKGFAERLQKELNLLLPETPCSVERMPRRPELAVWIGGCVMASVEMFQSVSASRIDYHEEGKARLARRLGLMNE